ncbi:hypothetical protein DH2020_038810 [Rehmannia glutinosa]|uniref:Pentatricopeptide repeat-containing protein n=1 Tax=Rehmannia glutinosa TaxID=99300 RepID=A0ABR0UY20_REHGL
MATKNISRTPIHLLPPPSHHLYSTAAAAAWYKPPPSRRNPQLQESDPILTTLSQAIQYSPTKPLQASLKHLLPSLKPQQIINLISLNPHSLSPLSLFSFFTWLSSPCNSTFRHTLDSYCTMIHFLCTHQMFIEANSLIQIVVSRKGKDSASAVFAAVLETRGTLGSDIYVFSGLISAYLELGFTLDAIQCFRLSKMHKFRVPFDTCKKVLEHLMKLKSYKLVWEFYEEILECGYPASLYFFNILMHRFCREGEMRLALSVFDGIRKWGLRPSVVSFNTLMNGYVRLGDLDEGFGLKSAMQASGIKPDVYTYSVLINGLCKERKMDDANKLFDEMLENGLVPNSVTFTTMIDGHCKNGRVDLAMEIYRQMLTQGLSPDLITYNTIINGLCNKGDLKQAHNLIDEMCMKGLKPDKITYTTLIDGSCKEGDLEIALELKAKMIKESIALDDVAYTALISGLCQGRAVDAERMLREMLRVGLKPDDGTYTMIINGFVRTEILGRLRICSGRCKEKDMYRVNPDDITYNILLEGHCKYGNPEDVSNVRSAKGLVLDYASYTSVIGSLSKASRFRSRG